MPDLTREEVERRLEAIFPHRADKTESTPPRAASHWCATGGTLVQQTARASGGSPGEARSQRRCELT